MALAKLNSASPDQAVSSALRTLETERDGLTMLMEAIGNGLGSLFLFIGSFSIIAGVLLLVNIFVMLAEERKAELGLLRAVGMRRHHLAEPVPATSADRRAEPDHTGLPDPVGQRGEGRALTGVLVVDREPGRGVLGLGVLALQLG